MNIEKADLERAAIAGLISAAQAELLWQALADRNNNETGADGSVRPRFDLAHVAYYFGALIVISAMGWFLSLSWESFGGGGIFFISLVYAGLFIAAGYNLWHRQNLKVPGGLLVTMAVSMAPLAIYGLLRLTGLWHQGDPGVYQGFHVSVQGSRFLLELGTILSSLVALRFFAFPFLTAPIAFCLWYMSMDLTPRLLGKLEYTWDDRLWVSFWFGLGMLILAYGVDLRCRRRTADYAFWLYLFGMLSFWGGMSLMNTNSEGERFIYCVINLGLMVLSVLLKRRLLIVFGGFWRFGLFRPFSLRGVCQLSTVSLCYGNFGGYNYRPGGSVSALQSSH
ncbi:DUF2157 domain-containing protein [Neosynechococcus sphagnicola]|uniref:DUF2157 domain-containing protein n=1 Tax=Neosynechococcus sphagnicola TaxID=1501145 RepID=UPI000A673954|nr:DUF2157 domain-containing protein [Neosynechococcus sphagnicola]